jgi:hypothetical protein
MLFFVQWFLFVLFPCRNLFNLLPSSKIIDRFARILHLVWVGWAVVDYHILLKLFLLNHHKLVFVVEIFIYIIANFCLLRILFGLSVVAFRDSINESKLVILVESDWLFARMKYILRFVMSWLLFIITASVPLSFFLTHVFHGVLWNSLRVFSRIFNLSF